MIRKALGDELAEHPLDGDVDLGDEIDGALLVDADVAAEARHLASPARTTASMAVVRNSGSREGTTSP